MFGVSSHWQLACILLFSPPFFVSIWVYPYNELGWKRTNTKNEIFCLWIFHLAEFLSPGHSWFKSCVEGAVGKEEWGAQGQFPPTKPEKGISAEYQRVQFHMWCSLNKKWLRSPQVLDLNQSYVATWLIGQVVSFICSWRIGELAVEGGKLGRMSLLLGNSVGSAGSHLWVRCCSALCCSSFGPRSRVSVSDPTRKLKGIYSTSFLFYYLFLFCLF